MKKLLALLLLIPIGLGSASKPAHACIWGGDCTKPHTWEEPELSLPVLLPAPPEESRVGPGNLSSRIDRTIYLWNNYSKNVRLGVFYKTKDGRTHSIWRNVATREATPILQLNNLATGRVILRAKVLKTGTNEVDIRYSKIEATTWLRPGVQNGLGIDTDGAPTLRLPKR